MLVNRKLWNRYSWNKRITGIKRNKFLVQDKKKAIFLDRDGTLNRDFGYVYRTEQLEILPGVVEALTIFRDAGFLLIVVTNQSGVGRGLYTKEDAAVFNKALKRALEKNRIRIAKYYICYHAPEEKCICRKPSPYLIYKAVKDFNIDMKTSFLFGDKESDTQCGENVPVASFLITKDKSLLFWAEKLRNKNFEI